LIESALRADKSSRGNVKLCLSSRTVWVMILYGVTENLHNLLADQNYV
jgi:SSS family solute:Na+ symporter